MILLTPPPVASPLLPLNLLMYISIYDIVVNAGLAVAACMFYIKRSSQTQILLKYSQI